MTSRERAASGVRFDARSTLFRQISDEYCVAIGRADDLRRRRFAAEARGRLELAERLERELAEAEAPIDAAYSALTDHTRRTAVAPMRERCRPATISQPRARSPRVA